MTKTCRSCSVEKPLTDFYSHPACKDGRRSQCKRCHSAKVEATRDVRREDYLAKKRIYNHTHREILRVSDRRHSQQYRLAYPEKRRARQLLRWALDAEKIQKPTQCEECGQKSPTRSDGRSGLHGHHYFGYAEALVIVWLCAMCHSWYHRRALSAQSRKDP